MTDMNNPNHGGYGEWPQQQPHQPQAQQPHQQQAQQQHPYGQHPQYPPQQAGRQPGHQRPYDHPVDDPETTAVLPPVPAFDDPAATTVLPPVPATDDAAATTLLPPVVVSGAMPVAPPTARRAAPPQHPGQAPGRHQAPAQRRPQPQSQPKQQQPQYPNQPQYTNQPQQQPAQQHQQQPLAQQHQQQAPAQPQPPHQHQQPSRARHAAPVPAPAPQPAAAQQTAEAFDPPTMTLKRPGAPGPAGAAGPGSPTGVPGTPPFAAAPAQPVAAAGPRGRTGSPIVDPGLQPALITAGTAALLAAGAALGQVGLALVVALLQLLTAAGWFRLNGMWPARQGILLAALAGFTADAAVLLADSDGGVAAVVGSLGGFFLLVLVLQTFRPSDPKERFYALTVLGSATVVTVLCTTLLLADWVPAGVGAVALATVLAAAPLPGPKQLGPVLGLVAAVALGLLVGAPVVLGALAGLGALIGRRVAAYDFPSRFVHMTAGVALPLAVAAPLIWMATDLLA
ncbi:hypothetical protein [Streptomyces sp. NRRL S-350]|uniref:hypothetical protein n=1 Tax=Streptomyces sp. NRRL S-350 TaxID=1463902 RepID=UPI00068CA4A5|nr:hypothetical protein [Streptomyces sp. NRRL S-350]